MRRVAIAGLATLALVACGGGGTPGPPARSFDSVKQMVAAMKAGGVTCASLHAATDLIASDAGQCKIDGVTVRLDIYKSAGDRDRALAVARRLATSGSALVGPDWTVGTRSETVAEKVQALLGGELQSL